MGNTKKSSLNPALPIANLVLFSIYPIIVLYAYNTDQLALTQIILPIVTSLAISVLVTGIFFIFTRQLVFSIFASLFFMAVFWYYGVVWVKLNNYFAIEHWHLIPIVLFICGHFVYFLNKIKKPSTYHKLSVIFILPLILLVLFNFLKIIPQEIKKKQLNEAEHIKMEEEKSLPDNETHPDIFLIVLDEYSEFRTIRDEWGYTDSTFYNFLVENDFRIIPESHSRFANTTRALPSLLNLSYVSNDLSHIECLNIYDDNFIFRFFDQLGYDITFINGWVSFGYSNRIESIKVINVYDNNFAAEEQIDPFHYLAFSQSLFRPIMYMFQENTSNIFYLAHKYFFNFIESQASQRKSDDKPLFSYAHIMSPHLPFVFDREGNFTKNPTNFWEYKSLNRETLKALYLEQYIYVNKRMIGIVEKILDNSHKESIILLMSDHGPRDMMAADEYHRKVLNAVYFPDKEYAQLYDSIAPLNTLRVLLNKYFDQSFEMIDDI